MRLGLIQRLLLDSHSGNLPGNEDSMFNNIPEDEARWTRRQFMRTASALTVGTACGRTLLTAAESEAPFATTQRSTNSSPATKAAPLMQIGVLLGTFGRGTLEQRLDCVKACGLDCVQVSLDCAGPPAMPDEIPVDSAQKARRLLDEISSPHLKVTMDAANIFHAGELPRMSEILDEAFALVGKDIVLAHAKDLDHDGDAGHKAAGQGKLDYARYLALLIKYGFTGPLLLHALSEAQVPGCVAFLREKLNRVVSEPVQSKK
jgi:hypothetical protein